MSNFAEAMTTPVGDDVGEMPNNENTAGVDDREGSNVKVDIDEKIAAAVGIPAGAKGLNQVAVDLPGLKGVFVSAEAQTTETVTQALTGTVGDRAMEVSDMIASMLVIQRNNIVLAPDQFEEDRSPEAFTQKVRDLAAKMVAAKKAS